MEALATAEIAKTQSAIRNPQLDQFPLPSGATAAIFQAKCRTAITVSAQDQELVPPAQCRVSRARSSIG